jgi:carboxypeptidase family protein
MKRSKKRNLFVLFVLAAMLVPPAVSTALGSGTAGRVAPTTPVVAPDDDDDEAMIDSATAGADVRVVVAAPRAAILGRAAEVLVVPRRDRTVNVVMGETVRFVSGVREAVWYRGAGSVDSSLAVFESDPNSVPALLGRDHVLLLGSAPKIDSGRARVDTTFTSLGAHDVTAVAGVTAALNHARGARDARRVHYLIQVWNAADLGDITGTVAADGAGTPLAGMRVVALDAATHELAAADITSCDGTYDLRRLPPGDYLVAVRSRFGFIGSFFDGAPDASTATPVPVTAGTSTPNVDFVLSHK